MSHFTTLKTKITDASALVKALADMGLHSVEVHQMPQHLYGYQGDVRSQTAEVIIRRQFVGHASNDIGFKLTKDGTFEAIISEYDRSQFSREWLNKLTQRYAYHVTRDKLEKQGFKLVTEQTEHDGKIRLVLQR